MIHSLPPGKGAHGLGQGLQCNKLGKTSVTPSVTPEGDRNPHPPRRLLRCGWLGDGCPLISVTPRLASVMKPRNGRFSRGKFVRIVPRFVVGTLGNVDVALHLPRGRSASDIELVHPLFCSHRKALPVFSMPFRTERIPRLDLTQSLLPEYQKVLGQLPSEGGTQESCPALMTTDHTKDRDCKTALKAQ